MKHRTDAVDGGMVAVTEYTVQLHGEGVFHHQEN
jgi:hypothetical protein